MLTRANPLGIDATKQADEEVVLTDQIKKLHERIQNGESDRAHWIQKQKILIEQRRGVRRPKAIPWAGANNDNWPVTDAVIRKWKPGIASLVTDADPVAYFFATKAEEVMNAQGAQAFYHWKFFQMPNVRSTIMELVDMVAQHGLAYTRQGWEYRTERRCRVIRADAHFPGGIEATLEQVNAGIDQANQQLAQAQAQGQADPQQQAQAPLEPHQFVKLVLQEEYKLDDSDRTRDNKSMLEMAVDALIQGAKHFKIYYEVVVADRPSWKALSPLDVVRPMKGGDVQDADFVAIVHRMTEDQILRMTRDGLFKRDASAEVIEKFKARNGSDATTGMDFNARGTGQREQITRTLEQIEGTSSQFNYAEPALAPIWEVYCHLDVNADGILEKCIMWYDPINSLVLSVIEYPMPFREWGIIQFEFEHTSDRPYSSRGIAELLSTFQKQTNKIHNARLDAIQVLLSPMFKMRAVNGDIPRNIRFRPGTIVPVSDPNDLQPLIMDFRPLGQFIQEEQMTKTLAEQYVGVFDSSLTQLGGGGSERRTATEVEAVTSQIGNVFSQDAALFQSSMAKVHSQLWQLWVEFGPDEEYFRVLGEEQPRVIKKHEIDRNFDIYPAGTPANTNKALALSRAREYLQFFGPDQTGLINKQMLYKNYFDLTDRNLAKLIVRSEEEAMAVQQILQAAKASTGGKQDFQAF